MKILNCHERMIAAPPERTAALVADFGLIWPAQIAPVPQRQGDRRYDTGLMLWEETDRHARRLRCAGPRSNAGNGQRDAPSGARQEGTASTGRGPR